MHARLDQAEVPNTLKVYDKMIHAFQLFDSPETDQSMKDIEECYY